jgi:hypothetical protein
VGGTVLKRQNLIEPKIPALERRMVHRTQQGVMGDQENDVRVSLNSLSFRIER